MNILLTGGSGFVPSNIVRQLARSGNRVVSIDVTPPHRNLKRFLADVSDRVSYVEADICDAGALATIAKDFPIDAIVHAAVITAVNPTIEVQDPTRTVEANVLGTTRMLDLARGIKGLKRFIYVSSSGVYGTTKDQDITINEDYPVNLPTLYAITKYASENITRRYGEMYSFSAASVRIGAPYGPMDRQTWARNERNVVCDIIDHAINGREIVVTPAGLAFSRDWTHVDDTAAGIEAALTAPKLSARHVQYVERGLTEHRGNHPCGARRDPNHALPRHRQRRRSQHQSDQRQAARTTRHQTARTRYGLQAQGRAQGRRCPVYRLVARLPSGGSCLRIAR